jgi:hypothetical protein
VKLTRCNILTQTERWLAFFRLFEIPIQHY